VVKASCAVLRPLALSHNTLDSFRDVKAPLRQTQFASAVLPTPGAPKSKAWRFGDFTRESTMASTSGRLYGTKFRGGMALSSKSAHNAPAKKSVINIGILSWSVANDC
jgi:hypothetical protein